MESDHINLKWNYKTNKKNTLSRPDGSLRFGEAGKRPVVSPDIITRQAKGWI